MNDSTPSALLELVEKYFVDADRVRAVEILTSYKQRFSMLADLERVRRDMVIVSRGDLAKLTRLAERDYRDVIMEAEYELREGKIVRRAKLD